MTGPQVRDLNTLKRLHQTAVFYEDCLRPPTPQRDLYLP